ncbi:ubiquinol-cytochrome c reductase complex 7.8 kDa protein, putative [Perkinsus marinus ATCC 50983]|uniref:Ubiquinol-cytochrome c reductase complex 7.8 kDa protein, putative n=2 Tax=Perkinsus marinus TaxID=31276 RepID=C5L0W9_PERM5|nr:ubiquinol-cytochrome c reductase complex 7.8 kDa protein, putative [Perkinsus marinus ATCC 50983]XP_002776275.1 ubiquinol-cytochrome c reductase complex 7.8 kDa protein, putative [Perkinsus marinus ATCC 50983]XP_002777816.1 ubiquinol-cytochrome c reductase complex 7.8 kDa protein, putative [Perkinsus marinus ATCC 50983]EER06848.1 ubiquinol-cytochrome c reductase complex 7.8 kDa protein, putative [Perkinsus marinus ATCC 50983]EER08091.1 ubiquinol-cytochrome c reductase complex 7.8 kDa protein|eukprot:XP_002775032.1 ubiquinol-cytochrome c reductase complex 7.8 kDa protein, putative [Perkinsus marinus ATCC 50983]
MARAYCGRFAFMLDYPKSYHPPRKNEDGDYVDPRTDMLPKCAAECSEWLTEYNACVQRIKMRTDGRGNCQGQYEEFAMCQDHCIAHELFHYLK